MTGGEDVMRAGRRGDDTDTTWVGTARHLRLARNERWIWKLKIRGERHRSTASTPSTSDAVLSPEIEYVRSYRSTKRDSRGHYYCGSF